MSRRESIRVAMAVGGLRGSRERRSPARHAAADWGDPWLGETLRPTGVRFDVFHGWAIWRPELRVRIGSGPRWWGAAPAWLEAYPILAMTFEDVAELAGWLARVVRGAWRWLTAK